jgi:hypothetical protein
MVHFLVDSSEPRVYYPQSRYGRNGLRIMSTAAQKIKKLMIDHEIASIALLAREYEQTSETACSREQMSMCINGLRDYPELQAFLANKFGRTVEQLFGAEKKARKAA